MTLQDRQQLVESVRFYAVKLAKSFYKSHHPLVDFKDVIQAAMLGATEAAQKYDENHESGAKFLTYAASPMLNRVITLYRSSTPAKIPRREYDVMPPTERGRCVWAARVTLSQPAYRYSDTETTLADMLPDTDGAQQEVVYTGEDLRKHVREMVACLPPKEQFVVKAAFGLTGLSEVRLSDIATYRGVTRQAVHQQLTSALKKLERMAINRGLAT